MLDEAKTRRKELIQDLCEHANEIFNFMQDFLNVSLYFEDVELLDMYIEEGNSENFTIQFREKIEYDN